MKNKAKINRTLGARGLSTLEKPRDLLPQIAFLIKTHQQFRGLLMKVELDQRRSCYESLKPYLSFAPKTLETYEIEAKQQAEQRQLPTLNPDGTLKPFEVGEVGMSEERMREKATEAIRIGLTWDKVKRSLVLTCGKCTAEAEFFGETIVEAISFARKAGWVYDKHGEKEQEICPRCPAIREHVN